MTHDEAFLQTILAHPDDPLARLVYADWLEERGDPRGEFLRVQCELARTAPDAPQRKALAVRERELFRQQAHRWLPERLRVGSEPSVHDPHSDFWRLHVNNSGSYGMRRDGQIVYFAWSSPNALRIERDLRLRNLVLFQGSLTQPELRLLIPPRPIGSSECPQCGGSGVLPPEFGKAVCYCGGLGWLPPRQVTAIISDIHGNFEALRAVLQDAKENQAGQIYCLGDTLGYGPNPWECVDIALHFSLVLLGNFDQATLFGADGFSHPSERSIFWAKRQLEPGNCEPELAHRRWAFLKECQPLYREDDVLFVHGSPQKPLNEYVFPEDIYNESKVQSIFAAFDRLCFAGHTHVPGVFTEDRQFHSPEELGSVYRLDDRKTLVNVGSVGQPRDGDWRACYVLFDETTVRFRRIAYDIDRTIRKIHALPELENFLGDRLRDGR